MTGCYQNANPPWIFVLHASVTPLTPAAVCVSLKRAGRPGGRAGVGDNGGAWAGLTPAC